MLTSSHRECSLVSQSIGWVFLQGLDHSMQILWGASDVPIRNGSTYGHIYISTERGIDLLTTRYTLLTELSQGSEMALRRGNRGQRRQ